MIIEDIAREIFESAKYKLEISEESIREWLEANNYDLFNEIDRSEVEQIAKRVLEMLYEMLVGLFRLYEQEEERVYQATDIVPALKKLLGDKLKEKD